MKNIYFIFVLVMISVPGVAQTPPAKTAAVIQTTDLKPPGGWWKTGSNGKDYDFHLDQNVKRTGKAGGTIRSRPTAAKGSHGAMMQAVKPDNYRGKRIRLSGYLKTENVLEWSGFWLRIDGADDDIFELDFDNMANRPITGTTDWKKYEVVLDVPEKAELIAFGVNLNGSGQAWADDLLIEVVGKDVVSTSLPSTPHMEEMKKETAEALRKDPKELERLRQVNARTRVKSPIQPVNLDFEMPATK